VRREDRERRARQRRGGADHGGAVNEGGARRRRGGFDLGGIAVMVILDALTCAAYGTGVAWLKPHLAAPSMALTAAYAAAFVLLCVAVYGIRKLHTGRPYRLSVVLSYSSFGFAVMFLLMLAHTSGIIAGLDSGALDGDYDWIWGTAVVFAALAYPILFVVDVDATVKPGTARFTAIQIAAVVAINAMLVAVGAFWEVYFFDSPGPPPETRSLATMLFMYPLFLMFFASPRFVLILKDLSWVTLASALGSTAYYVWYSLPAAG